MLPDYEIVAQRLADRVGDVSYGHCVRVAETAVRLASRCGVDPERARIAGLLHDWDRDLDQDELREAAAAHALDVVPEEASVPYLLHARTGAAAVGEAFPSMPSDVIQAIARHTVGDPSMTDLDMVVFLADMLEPARSFEGAEELRRKADELSLEELFAQAYAVSVAHLVHKRRRIHPTTVEVWNALIAKGTR